jgi:hypothetical protein
MDELSWSTILTSHSVSFIKNGSTEIAGKATLVWFLSVIHFPIIS